MPGPPGFPLLTTLTNAGWTAGATLAALIDGDPDGRELIDSPPPGSRVRVQVALLGPKGETVIEQWTRPAAPGDILRVTAAVEVALAMRAERDAQAAGARAAG